MIFSACCLDFLFTSLNYQNSFQAFLILWFQVDIDFEKEPIGTGKDGKSIYFTDIWPSTEEIAQVMEPLELGRFDLMNLLQMEIAKPNGFKMESLSQKKRTEIPPLLQIYG